MQRNVENLLQDVLKLDEPLPKLDQEKLNELNPSLDKLLRRLNPKQEAVIRGRFGIGCKKETMENLGNRFSVSRTAIGFAETSALRKLQRHSIERVLVADALNINLEKAFYTAQDQADMLMSIPEMNRIAAKKILERFGNLRNLVNYSKDDDKFHESLKHISYVSERRSKVIEKFILFARSPDSKPPKITGMNEVDVIFMAKQINRLTNTDVGLENVVRTI